MLKGLKQSGSLLARASLSSSFPQAFPPNLLTAMFYCGSVTIFFTVIKLISYRLHLMFDKGEVIQHRSPRKRSKRRPEGEASSQQPARHKIPRYPCPEKHLLPKEKKSAFSYSVAAVVGLSTWLAHIKAWVGCWAPRISGIVVCVRGRWRWEDWEFKVTYRCTVNSRPMCAT